LLFTASNFAEKAMVNVANFINVDNGTDFKVLRDLAGQKCGTLYPLVIVQNEENMRGVDYLGKSVGLSWS
jgi:hypothetical protein